MDRRVEIYRDATDSLSDLVERRQVDLDVVVERSILAAGVIETGRVGQATSPELVVTVAADIDLCTVDRFAHRGVPL